MTRAAKSAALLTELRTWLEKTQMRISGKSDLAGAIRYTLSRWEALTLILRDGRTCIDNNAAERSMRPMCLGRKNWLFAGSDSGGERAAAVYSLIETAKLNGFDPQDYLRQVLAQIADHPARRDGRVAFVWQGRTGMTEIKATNITWHEGHATREERHAVLKQKGATLWFTGLSGSGKSTAAFTLEHALVQRGHLAYVLDGDNIRHGLNKNLGFSAADREENIRRIGEVAKLFADCGVLTMTSFISPYRKDRELVRALHAEGKLPFIEIHLATPIEACEQRDPKGLYKKARAGQLKNFTGIDDPYEAPEKPELTIDATGTSPQEATVQLMNYLRAQGIIR